MLSERRRAGVLGIRCMFTGIVSPSSFHPNSAKLASEVGTEVRFEGEGGGLMPSAPEPASFCVFRNRSPDAIRPSLRARLWDQRDQEAEMVRGSHNCIYTVRGEPW